ncbi:uncharacterized protein B0H18DRAFT_1033569 [Fomitopsis serialis]|uniref:uncharacterized protein n=1 Tax=Fomitopsis serialis TaxID=139415 RepID=UPI00200770E4|nr:uncharacterized protein B0H18DRAFT_1033569 [Neoantrodia serialis]KAH9917726.1 hypothetical protein B0H18DRAFT_1033569 [Neoantrodia serialis]
MSPTALEILVSTLPTCRNWLLWFVVWLTGHLTGNFPSVTCLGRSLLARNPELQTATSPPPLDTFYSGMRLLRLRPSDRSVKTSSTTLQKKCYDVTSRMKVLWCGCDAHSMAILTVSQ